MIIDPLLSFWVETLGKKLKDETNDELKLKICKKSPFQDDPIRQAPYLLIGENEDPGKGITQESLFEIGGTFWWIAHMRIKASPRSQKTSDRAYYLVDLLGQRIIYLLRLNSFAHPHRHGAPLMDNRDWTFITQVYHKVYGGEGEWLSYVQIDFYNRVSEKGPFPYGEYPGTIDP